MRRLRSSWSKALDGAEFHLTRMLPANIGDGSADLRFEYRRISGNPRIDDDLRFRHSSCGRERQLRLGSTAYQIGDAKSDAA